MIRRSHARASLLAASLAALAGCAAPALTRPATPGPGWPDLAQPPVGEHDGWADAALIIVIDDPALGGRPGAHAVASGWWRYLVETRGLRSRRVRLLRNEEARVRVIEAAVEQLEERSGIGAVLWLIYIGEAVSPSDGGDGALRAGDGDYVAFAPIREALGTGLHESAFMLVDGCAASPEPDLVAGLAAAPPPEAQPRFLAQREPLRVKTYYSSAERGFAEEVQDRVEAELRNQTATRRSTFVLTAGLGPACTSTLGAKPWPALAYAGLGGLQGWADIDEDGQVGAVELATYAQSVLAELDEVPKLESRAQVSAAGVDLILADVSRRWDGPGRPGAVARLAPEQLSQTGDSLEQASTQLVLDVEDMVSVTAGSFWMGCRFADRKRCEDDERPARWTSLRGYAIDRHEVRWRDYRACILAGACDALKLDECWVWTGEGFLQGAELPAELFGDELPAMCVSWIEAQNYCEAVGKRLPTEAEWERAARGRDSRTYPWGEDDPRCKFVNMHGCAGFAERVGSHPQGVSPVGAQDMSGNVSEWVFDWWSKRAYLRADHADPLGPERGQVRGVRGGSFYESDFNLRTGYRYGIDPLARLSTVGFRCVR